MTKYEFREVTNEALKSKGIRAFEEKCATIKWMHHPKEDRKKYLVVDTAKGEVVFEADVLPDIAKKYGVANSSIWQCLHTARLLAGKYSIMKSEDM